MTARKIQTPGETQVSPLVETQFDDTQGAAGIDVNPEATKPTYEELEARVADLTHEITAQEITIENLQNAPAQNVELVVAKTTTEKQTAAKAKLTDKGWVC